MGYITMYGDNLMLGSLLTPGEVAMPDTVYLALLTTLIDRNVSDGSALAEPDTGANYQRMEYGLGSDYWFAGVGVYYNSQAVQWPVPNANWGRILGWALVDDAETGNVIATGALVPEVTIVAGANVQLPEMSLYLKMV